VPSTNTLAVYANQDVEWVIPSADQSREYPDRLEVIPTDDNRLVLEVHEYGFAVPEIPATFLLDREGADQLREILDIYFPRPGDLAAGEN
jgi:hypothetical protein